MIANEDRGEVEITLDGKTYPMRPSWAAIKRIEAESRPITVLVRQAVGQELPIDIMAVIVCAGIQAAADEYGEPQWKAFKVERVAALIYEAGALSVLDPVLRFLVNALNGGRSPKKKAVKRDGTPTITSD